MQDEPPGTGGTVGKIADARMHSAEHILSATMNAMFACGKPFTTHLEKKKSKADYRFHRELTPEESAELERRVNEIIASDLAVTGELLPRAEAQKFIDLGRLPDSAGDIVRIIRIGDYDATPCKGIHVRSTKEIGSFRLVSTSYADGALRVRFKLG